MAQASCWFSEPLYCIDCYLVNVKTFYWLQVDWDWWMVIIDTTHIKGPSLQSPLSAYSSRFSSIVPLCAFFIFTAHLHTDSLRFRSQIFIKLPRVSQSMSSRSWGASLSTLVTTQDKHVWTEINFLIFRLYHIWLKYSPWHSWEKRLFHSIELTSYTSKLERQ